MLLLWITDTSKDHLQRNAVQIRAMSSKTAEVGTVVIASAVGVDSGGQCSPGMVHLHGGGDDYGPYGRVYFVYRCS